MLINKMILNLTKRNAAELGKNRSKRVNKHARTEALASGRAGATHPTHHTHPAWRQPDAGPARSPAAVADKTLGFSPR